MATTYSTSPWAWDAPIANDRGQSWLNQRQRVFELRRSVACHPRCEMRAANLERAERELESRFAEAYPDQVRRPTEAELGDILDQLTA